MLISAFFITDVLYKLVKYICALIISAPPPFSKQRKTPLKTKIGFLTEKANFLVFFLRKITILWGWVFLAMARCQ